MYLIFKVLAFAFKKIGVKQNVLPEVVVEDGKMQKQTMLKKLCLVNFFKFGILFWSILQSLESANRPKNTHSLIQWLLRHLLFLTDPV